MSYAAKSPKCEGCPAYENGHSFVPGCGPPTARVALIGQGPGKEEAEGHWSIELQQVVRAPFIGRSGKTLNQWLDRVNRESPELPPLRREDCWVDNTVRCLLKRGAKDREPTAAERAFCAEAHLKPALRALPNLQVLVPIGVPAIKGVMGEDTGELWAGGTYKLEGWL